MNNRDNGSSPKEYNKKYIKYKIKYRKLQNDIYGGNNDTTTLLQNIDLQLLQYINAKKINVNIETRLELINQFDYDVDYCITKFIDKKECNREKFIKRILNEKIETVVDIIIPSTIMGKWGIIHIICKYFIELLESKNPSITSLFSYLNVHIENINQIFTHHINEYDGTILHYLIRDYYKFKENISRMSKNFSANQERLSTQEQKQQVENFKSINSIINMLFKNKSMIKYVYRGINPLMTAIMDNNIIWVNNLININSPMNIQSNNGSTPLILAIINDNTKIVTKLLDSGASMEICNNDGQNAFSCAIEYDPPNIDIIKLMLEKNKYIIYNECSNVSYYGTMCEPFTYCLLMARKNYNKYHKIVKLLSFCRENKEHCNQDEINSIIGNDIPLRQLLSG